MHVVIDQEYYCSTTIPYGRHLELVPIYPRIYGDFIVVTEVGWLQLIIGVHKNPNTRFRSSYAVCVSFDDNDDDNVDD